MTIHLQILHLLTSVVPSTVSTPPIYQVLFRINSHNIQPNCAHIFCRTRSNALSVLGINDNFWQAISVFMFQGECTVNLNNLFSKPSTPILTWTNPWQSFLGNYDYASHFTYDNSSVSVRFHFLVCCSITFRCIVVDSGNMLFIQVKGTHG